MVKEENKQEENAGLSSGTLSHLEETLDRSYRHREGSGCGGGKVKGGKKGLP